MSSLDDAFGSSPEQVKGPAANASSYPPVASVQASRGQVPMQAQAQVQASGPVSAPVLAQAQAQASQPADDFRTTYGRVLSQLTRFVAAIQTMTPSVDGSPEAVTTALRNKWNDIPAPKTIAELHAAVGRMYAMSPQQLSDTLGAADPSMRLYFHGQAIKLAQAVRADSDELAFAAATMRWFLQQALPALQNQAEEGQLGTIKEIRRNYAALDAACKVARPDETNPTVVAAAQNLKDAHAALQSLEAGLRHAEGRARRLGLDFSAARSARDATDDAALMALDDDAVAAMVRAHTPPPSSAKTVSIVLAVFLALALVAVIVLAVFLSRRSSNSGNAGGAVGAVGAGVSAGIARPTVPSVASPPPLLAGGRATRAFNPSESYRADWGFPPLPTYAMEPS